MKERAGTIAYRKEDGNFQGRKQLRKEAHKPDPVELTFFARFLIKNYLEDMTAGKPAKGRS